MTNDFTIAEATREVAVFECQCKLRDELAFEYDMSTEQKLILQELHSQLVLFLRDKFDTGKSDPKIRPKLRMLKENLIKSLDKLETLKVGLPTIGNMFHVDQALCVIDDLIGKRKYILENLKEIPNEPYVEFFGYKDGTIDENVLIRTRNLLTMEAYCTRANIAKEFLDTASNAFVSVCIDLGFGNHKDLMSTEEFDRTYSNKDNESTIQSIDLLLDWFNEIGCDPKRFELSRVLLTNLKCFLLNISRPTFKPITATGDYTTMGLVFTDGIEHHVQVCQRLLKKELSFKYDMLTTRLEPLQEFHNELVDYLEIKQGDVLVKTENNPKLKMLKENLTKSYNTLVALKEELPNLDDLFSTPYIKSIVEDLIDKREYTLHHMKDVSDKLYIPYMEFRDDIIDKEILIEVHNMLAWECYKASSYSTKQEMLVSIFDNFKEVLDDLGYNEHPDFKTGMDFDAFVTSKDSTPASALRVKDSKPYSMSTLDNITRILIGLNNIGCDPKRLHLVRTLVLNLKCMLESEAKSKEDHRNEDNLDEVTVEVKEEDVSEEMKEAVGESLVATLKEHYRQNGIIIENLVINVEAINYGKH